MKKDVCEKNYPLGCWDVKPLELSFISLIHLRKALSKLERPKGTTCAFDLKLHTGALYIYYYENVTDSEMSKIFLICVCFFLASLDEFKQEIFLSSFPVNPGFGKLR